MPNPRGSATQKINFWAMMNNVLIAALAKGQILPVLLFFLLFLMVLKMGSADVAALAFHILADLEKGNLLGYVLVPGISAGWYAHVRWQRRRYERELGRIAEKRDEIQEKVLPRLLESSQPERQKRKKPQ